MKVKRNKERILWNSGVSQETKDKKEKKNKRYQKGEIERERWRSNESNEKTDNSKQNKLCFTINYYKLLLDAAAQQIH